MIANRVKSMEQGCRETPWKRANEAPIVFRNMLSDEGIKKTMEDRQTKVLIVGHDKEYSESLAGTIDDMYEKKVTDICSCEEVRGKYNPGIYTHVMIAAEEYDEGAAKAKDIIFSMDPDVLTKIVFIKPKERQGERHKVTYLEHQVKVKELISALSEKDEAGGEIELSGSKQLDDVFNEIYNLYGAKRPESIDVHIHCGGSYFLPAEYKIKGRTGKP